jgi:hypothetical protein
METNFGEYKRWKDPEDEFGLKKIQINNVLNPIIEDRIIERGSIGVLRK